MKLGPTIFRGNAVCSSVVICVINGGVCFNVHFLFAALGYDHLFSFIVMACGDFCAVIRVSFDFVLYDYSNFTVVLVVGDFGVNEDPVDYLRRSVERRSLVVSGHGEGDSFVNYWHR